MTVETLSRRIKDLENQGGGPDPDIPAFLFLHTRNFYNEEDLERFKESHPAGRHIRVNSVNGKGEICWRPPDSTVFYDPATLEGGK